MIPAPPFGCCPPMSVIAVESFSFVLLSVLCGKGDCFCTGIPDVLEPLSWPSMFVLVRENKLMAEDGDNVFAESLESRDVYQRLLYGNNCSQKKLAQRRTKFERARRSFEWSHGASKCESVLRPRNTTTILPIKLSSCLNMR